MLEFLLGVWHSFFPICRTIRPSTQKWLCSIPLKLFCSYATVNPCFKTLHNWTCVTMEVSFLSFGTCSCGCLLDALYFVDIGENVFVFKSFIFAFLSSVCRLWMKSSNFQMLWCRVGCLHLLLKPLPLLFVCTCSTYFSDVWLFGSFQDMLVFPNSWLSLKTRRLYPL